MIIHVKRQLRHSCIKSVESEETRITQHMKKHLFVSFFIWRFHQFRYFFSQIQRFKIMVTYSSHHSLDFSCLNPWSLPCKSNVKELFSNYPQLWTHHTALHRGHTFISSFKMGSLIMWLFKSRVLLCFFSAVLDMIIVSHI